MLEETFVNVLKEIFGTNTAVNNSHKIPFTAADGTPAGLASISDLASVLGVDDPKYRALDIPIPFEDEGVKAIVAERYGGITGGLTQVPGMRGEITYRQAMAITIIGFGTSYTIGGPFNELRFFRNLTSIALNAFYGTGVTSLIIPEGVTFLGGSSVRGNTCYVEIPSTVTEIGSFVFYQGRYTIKIWATAPPTLGTIDVSSITKVMVPQASLAAYQQANGWSALASVMEGF